MPSDSSEYLAGGVDIGGPQGGQERRERPSRDEYEDPPPRPPDSRTVCGTCGAEIVGENGRCSWPANAAGRCPVMLRKRAGLL
jgi:hypothetical protein